ncbi:MAG: hypothetical protein R2730_05825 [Chitinophagales bacterium]
MQIQVEYYNDTEKELFLEYNNIEDIERIIGNVEIEKEEFFTYLLFTQQCERDGLRNYKDFSKLKDIPLPLFDKFFDIDNSIKAIVIGKHNYKDFVERIGVSLSLCVMNELHNTHHADWQKVPETNFKKTLDFLLASDANRFIEVESKGTTNNDNSKKTPSVINQFRKIKDKKKQLRSENLTYEIKGNNLAYGVVSVLDNREDSIARCLLVDPIANNDIMSPRKYKLLSRLYYYYYEMFEISPYSNLTLLLKNRIQVLEKLIDIEQLNNVPLVDSKGEPLYYRNNSYSSSSVIKDKKTYFETHNTNKVIGRVYPYVGRRFLYIGLLEEIFEMLMRQNFDEIISYKTNYRTLGETLIWRLTKRDAKEFNIEWAFYEFEQLYRKGNNIEIPLSINSVYSSSGKIFGLISI